MTLSHPMDTKYKAITLEGFKKLEHKIISRSNLANTSTEIDFIPVMNYSIEIGTYALNQSLDVIEVGHNGLFRFFIYPFWVEG